MRIKMLKTAAGPFGVFQAGSVVDVDDELATAFCEGGAASAVAEVPPEPAAPPESEPVAEDAPETPAEPEPAVVAEPETDYSTLTVTALKQELKRRGLARAGVKAELVTRLQENDADGSSVG